MRLVWSPEVATDRRLIQLATDWRNSVLVAHSFLRVVLPSARQPHRLCWKRRPLFLGATESNPGVRITRGFRHIGTSYVPERRPPLEPLCRIPLSCWSSLFRVHAIVAKLYNKKTSPKVAFVFLWGCYI